MKLLFLKIALLALLVGCAHAPRDAAMHRAADARDGLTIGQSKFSGAILFWGKVRLVRMLFGFEGTVVPVDVDPRWVVTVDITGTSKIQEPIRPGNTVNFAVHSPTRVFAGTPRDQRVNKSFEFVIRARTNGWHRLEARQKKK